MLDEFRFQRVMLGLAIACGPLGLSIGLAQVQTQKLTASDAYAGQQFGWSMAADGDWIAAGVVDDDEAGSQAGAAYVFQRVGGAFQQTQKLFASDAEAADLFGWSVAMHGDVIAVGAQNGDSNISGTGAVYVFERTASAWIETAKLNAAASHAGMTFGWSVARDGNRIVVGARDENNKGAAYIFERSGATWSQTARLVASDGQVFDFFGQSVAIYDDVVLVGSAADAPGGTGQGAAYVFEFNGVAWGQTQKLFASDGENSGAFSSQIALGDGHALVGAANHAHGLVNSGSVYAFVRQASGVWLETQEIRSHAPGISHLFGVGLALEGDLAVVGASKDPSLLTGLGCDYALRRVGGVWEEIGRMDPNDLAYADLFGSRVTLNGTEVVVGSPRHDGVCPTNVNCNSGAVYVFDLAPDARQFGWCMSSAPCGNTFNIGGCLNSTGVGATLAAAGSSSVVRNELRFEVRDVQPNRNAIVFMGNGVGQAVLGDGLRVVASGTSGFYRYGVQLSGADGSFQQTGIVAKSQTFATPGHIQAGSVWNFQCWYRDPNGPCGKGTNVTNAVEVTFGP